MKELSNNAKEWLEAINECRASGRRYCEANGLNLLLAQKASATGL